MFIMFWQNMAGLLLALVWLSTGACPISERYRSVLAASTEPPLSSTIPSFSGISAAALGWFLAASSSSSAWEVAMAPLFPRSGAISGVQPSAGSRKSSMSALSLPLTSTLAPFMRAALALLSCAVWPVAGFIRYMVVTLSLGSWSIMSKLRVVGHSRPVPSAPALATMFLAIPADGMSSRPLRSIRNAALKKFAPLQNDTCPKGDAGDPGMPSMQLPWLSASGVAPFWSKNVPLNPKSMVTIAFLGSFGTTGLTAGVVPAVMTRGLYTYSLPVRGSRMVAWTNAPRLSELTIWQPVAAGDPPAAPVSWYGVARPLAVSGWAGTMMSQVSSTAVDETPAEPEDAAEWSFGVLCPDAPTTIPTVTPSAITAATGMAIHAARLFLPRRRRADRRPLSTQPTSIGPPWNALRRTR